MTNDQFQARTYGGWRRSRSIGLLGLGPTATLILLGCAVALLLVAAVSLKTLIFAAPPALLAGAASLIRIGGIPIAQLGVQRLRWWHGTTGGHTSYRAEVQRSRFAGDSTWVIAFQQWPVNAAEGADPSDGEELAETG